MERVELLTVEDSFQIRGRGLVVIPDFSVPKGWKNRTDTVIIATPDGQETSIQAEFSRTHFKFIDRTAPPDEHWRVIVMLRDWQKGKLLAGTKLFVSPSIRDALLAGNGA
jgi:hypothetical protein